MNLYRQFMDRLFPPIQPIPAGLYHYQAPPDAAFPYRLHLRIEPDGNGLLIVNASTVVHLNRTAAEYVYHLVLGTPEEQVVEQVSKRYNASRETVQQDYHELDDRLLELVETPDLDPVAFLDFDRQDPYTDPGTAPYRLDCALTYRLPTENSEHFAPQDRVVREMSGEEWKSVLDKAWNVGIPHVIFTGGEPTLRPDLVELITHAERLGMVAGLITDGNRLGERKYLHELLQSGLDHVMILLDPHEDAAWEGLRDSLAEDIAVTVHLTLTGHTRADFDTVIDRLIEMGVQTLSLSAESLELKDELLARRDALAQRQVHLVWDLPVPYSQFHPVAVELAEGLPDINIVSTGPGRGWLYVEPDGDVLPGQGYAQKVLGNFLTDPWEAIWDNARQFTRPDRA